MKRTVRLTESDLTRLVKRVLSEQKLNEEENIVKGTSWDYLKKDGIYYARKTNTTKWILTSGEVANAIATKIFKTPIKTDNVKTQIKTNTVKSPFENKGQGDLFRQYVIKYYPNIAKKNDLSIKGAFNNSNIINSSNEIITTKKYGKIKLSDLFFKQNKQAKLTSSETGQTLPSLVKTGFDIDKSSFKSDLGYYVRKCTQLGCAEFTYDMIGNTFGDAWQAYSKFNQYANVTPDLVKKMTDVFNSINKSGMPTLNDSSVNDDKSKNIISSLVPSDQQQFNSLPLGAVVGLYYPDSSNFDLAFFQSAVGMSRDNQGKWVKLKQPYFCKQSDKCGDTLWKQNDENKNINFVPNSTLKSGKSFIPNTHIGFIGYIDSKGERYVVHNVHQTVYAFPISKMSRNTLSIIWAGTPKIN